MALGGGKYTLEKTWRASGTGTQNFNAPGNIAIPYGRYQITVAATGGYNAVGTAATYNANSIASYNVRNAATYNAQTVASYNTNTVSGFNPATSFNWYSYFQYFALVSGGSGSNFTFTPTFAYFTGSNPGCPAPGGFSNYVCTAVGVNANYNAQNPASYNAQNPTSYNAGTAATYNAQTAASYNAQTVATYNAGTAASFNAQTVVSYNAAVAGNASSALGVSAAGAPASNSPAQSGSTTAATLVSYYSYPDSNTYPVTVGSGGSVTIVSS